MLRRFAVAAFAIVALAQTGCHGRISAFFYRITHCGCCTPYYGYGGAPAASYGYPVSGYGAPGCCTSYGAGAPTGTVAYPASAPTVFTTPQPMTGTPVPPSPVGDKK